MSVLKGTNVASTVVPFTTEDMYATHDSLYGKGGYKEVATEQERDAIPETRLKEGTIVYVQDIKQEFRYVGGIWELINSSSGDQPVINSLDDITDVEVTDATVNQVLMYDGEKWVNSDIENSGTTPIINSLGDIADVNITTPTTDQILKYDGEKWVNVDDTSSDSEDIVLDDEVSETSENPVKSSGIFTAINDTVDNKFVVLSESEYDSIVHDAETFYFITK